MKILTPHHAGLGCADATNATPDDEQRVLDVTNLHVILLVCDVNGTRRPHAIEHGRVPVLVNRIYGN